MSSLMIKNIHLIRRTIQSIVILLIIAIPFIVCRGTTTIHGTFYSMSIGNLDINDPVLFIQDILLSKRIFFPLIIGAIVPVVATLILGKVFCGWVCPFNTIAEIGTTIKRKIKSISVTKKNPKNFYVWLSYLGILMLTIITGIPIITLISMPGQISGLTADLVFTGVIGFEAVIVFSIIIGEVLIRKRLWCKHICPSGATLNLFRYNYTLKIACNSKKCATCAGKKQNPCITACPLGLNPKRNGIYPYCYNCFDCIEACRFYNSALSITFKRALQNVGNS